MSKMLLARRALVPPFDPLSLAPSAWYKPETLATLQSNASVTSWPDSSGNNKHLVPRALAPLYTLAVANNRAGVRFSGSGDDMSTAAGLTARTFAMVCNHLDGASVFTDYRRLFAMGLTESISLFGVSGIGSYNSPVNFQRGIAAGQVRVNRIATVVATPLSNFRIVSAIGISQSVNERLTMGSYNPTAGLQVLKGYMCEFLAFPQALSLAQLSRVEEYLKVRWGL
jgi:hypothetical protein